MIKNWFVGTKQIRNSGIKHQYEKKILSGGKSEFKRKSGSKGKKITNGFAKHVYYLSNENADSHEYSDIHVLNDKSDNIQEAIHKRTAYRQENGLRGGGVVNYCTAMALALPRELLVNKKAPRKSDWMFITNHLIRDVAKINNIDPEVLKNHTHVVFHDESRSPAKNSHIHVLFSNVIDNEVVKGISQRKTTHAAKMSFNRSVKSILGYCNAEHQPVRKNVSRRSLWAVNQEKAKQADVNIKKAEDIIEKLKNYHKNIKSDISAWARSFMSDFLDQTQEKAVIVADQINDIDQVLPALAVDLDQVTDFIEKKKNDAPNSSKVSSKRKKRRRTNK